MNNIDELDDEIKEELYNLEQLMDVLSILLKLSPLCKSCYMEEGNNHKMCKICLYKK